MVHAGAMCRPGAGPNHPAPYRGDPAPGVAARLQVGDSADWTPLLQRLCRDRRLLEVLLPLDFKRLELCRDERGWQVTLEHFGASEVVNRLPGMRRYIRLNTEQREALLGSFSHLQRLLGGY